MCPHLLLIILPNLSYVGCLLKNVGDNKDKQQVATKGVLCVLIDIF